VVEKFIGDAVMAVWGAPIPVPNHAVRAVRAAWVMNQAGHDEIAGRRLRTRIGLNTGRVLAGNLGSRFRFDYTLIGDTTNLASRLEGLNKHLGTELLISGATAAALDGSIRLRALGRFLVPGKSRPVEIHEVLGPAADHPSGREWQAAFAAALAAFAAHDFDRAERLLLETIVKRGADDGPSRFYLAMVKKLREHGVPIDWAGEVKMTEK